jgi:hypothetical protein
VATLATAPKKSRIELALALADLDHEPGAVASFIKTQDPRKMRSIYALLEVGKWVTLTDVPMDRCERIGTTKLGILARHCAERPTRKATRTEFDLAEKETASELPALLAAGMGKKPEKRRTVLLRLTADQYAVFQAAVLAHGAIKAAKGGGQGKGLVGTEAALVSALSRLKVKR